MFKGQSVMDSGYFFAPYVPLTSTPVISQQDLKKKYNLIKREPATQENIPQKKYRSIDDPWEEPVGL